MVLPAGPNGSWPAWQDNRSYLHRRSVPLPSRSATRSAHRTTHPATPRPRPGRLHVLSLIRMVTGISTLGICCVEHRVRGVAEDALASFRPRLPESACNRATAKLTEATSRVDVAHRRRDPVAVPMRHARL